MNASTKMKYGCLQCGMLFSNRWPPQGVWWALCTNCGIITVVDCDKKMVRGARPDDRMSDLDFKTLTGAQASIFKEGRRRAAARN